LYRQQLQRSRVTPRKPRHELGSCSSRLSRCATGFVARALLALATPPTMRATRFAPRGRTTMSLRHLNMFAAALLVSAAALASARPANPLDTSFTQARALLTRSLAAHGGAERIGKLSAARLHYTGTISSGMQGPTPENVNQPTAEGGFDARWAMDFGKGRFRLQGTQTSNGGFVFPFIANYSSGTLLTLFQPRLAYVKNPVADVDEGREQSAGLGTRSMPPILLKLASQRLGTLRDEGPGTHDGKPVQRLGFNLDKNTRVTLLIDAESARVVGLEQLLPDPLTGTDIARWTYSGTQEVSGLIVPQSATVQRRGHRFLDIQYRSVAFDADAKLEDADFAVEADRPQIDAPTLDIAELKPGVWEVSNAGGGFYRVQFFELAERVIAFDAPVSPAVSRAVIAKFREKVPTKPISHVVLSHHHNDHVGGVRAFAEAGATIVTTADATALVQRFAAAQPRLAAVADAAPVELKFATVSGKLDLGDAKRPLTVLELSGSPHVQRTLVLVDPASRLAAGGDVYGDVGDFNAQYDWFAAWLAKRADIDTFAGAHHAATPVKTILQRQAEFRKKK
jgi:glyoxylase-like metal-dependent hydrolase (beta-lactamase superfamily II)